MNKDLILNEFRRVSEAMGWDSYHSPKNLASAVSVEAAKLLENFQWLSDVDSELIDDEQQRQKIAADMADVLIYITVLGHKLDLDPWGIVKDKLLVNRERYIELMLAKQLGLTNAEAPRPARRSVPSHPAAVAEAENTVGAAAEPLTAEPTFIEENAPSTSLKNKESLLKVRTQPDARSRNDEIDWDVVAKRIAASREEVREQALRLKQGAQKGE